jgi:ABC-type transport system involved in multi-copper enzyme maturation permease subunit
VSTGGNVQFQMVEERGWRRGFGNLLHGELSSWFKSSRWWKHIIMWLVIVNMFMVIFVFVSATDENMDVLMMYGIFGGMFVAVGTMIIVQGTFVSEKRAGTAAWVLSKPVTRTAFVVSRLVGNAIGVLVTAVLVPGVLVYLTLGILSDLGWLPPLSFLAGMASIALSTLFWLTLTLLAGTFLESTGGVIAVPIVTFFAAWLVPSLLPFLMYVSPVILFVGPGDEYPGVSLSLFNGQAPFSWIPVITTAVLSLVFIAVAVWRFDRQEF